LIVEEDEGVGKSKGCRRVMRSQEGEKFKRMMGVERYRRFKRFKRVRRLTEVKEDKKD